MPRGRSGLDRKDWILLQALEEDCRTPVAVLARLIELERTPCQARIRRLERLGYIKGYTIVRGHGDQSHVVGTEFILVAIATVSPADGTIGSIMDSIETYVTSQPSISWAGRVTGEYSFLIRVDEGAPGTIAKILRDLGELRGVSETKTMSVVEQIRKLLNQRSV